MIGYGCKAIFIVWNQLLVSCSKLICTIGAINFLLSVLSLILFPCTMLLKTHAIRRRRLRRITIHSFELPENCLFRSLTFRKKGRETDSFFFFHGIVTYKSCRKISTIKGQERKLKSFYKKQYYCSVWDP